MKEIAEIKIVRSVLLDLSKAFDSISHEASLSKQNNPKVFSTFTETSSKFSRTKVTMCENRRNNIYDWSKLKQGVAQGTVLGSLLFIRYTNDFSIALKLI